MITIEPGLEAVMRPHQYTVHKPEAVLLVLAAFFLAVAGCVGVHKLVLLFGG